MGIRIIYLIRVTYPIDRVTYPDKEVKKLPLYIFVYGLAGGFTTEIHLASERGRLY